MAGIFISYRRDDSAGHAGRLYDRLCDHFGLDQVFMDIDTIRPGRDFVDAVRQAVGGCDGLVAVIGPEWLTIPDASGARRLDDPKDLVRQEIAIALELGIRVVPVLVQGAQMPGAAEVPDGIKELARRNAQELSDRTFRSDVERLIEALEAPEPELPESDDFVGRQREMSELRTALDAAMGGRGQMVMLSGEPGIGKTRLAQELASRAESLGAQVLWGRCYEHGGAPPYWPFVQPIRTYIESADPKQLSTQTGSGGAVIAEILPELREKLPDLGQPANAEPEQARFRLFDSLATFLKNTAQSQPLVFIVDDLHWADSATLLMLEFLVRETADSRMLVLGTYRDAVVTSGHPLSQTLGNLVRERHYRRIQMGGLTQREVGEFVEANKGVTLPDDALETVHSRTEGNPLFVSEVVKLIDPGRMTENQAWAITIPEGVRDAIGSRLSRLSTNCNQVLGTASVMGREFDLSLLRSLCSDIGADGVLAALDEALEAKVIEELPESVGRYQFGHALIQQSLYGEMSSIRRLRAHASIAEALERMHGSTLAEHAAELARHFAEAQSLLGPEKLARYSLMAGERALAAYAYEDAFTHFERGLAARDIPPTETEAASDEETAALLFGLARAQSATGERHQLTEAFVSLTRAFDFYVEAGHVDLAVAAAQFRIALPSTQIQGASELLARALTLVKPDSHEAGRLLSRYGEVLGVAEGDYQGAQESLKRAMAIAKREGDVALELQTLTSAAGVHAYHLQLKESIASGLAAIDLTTGDENIVPTTVSLYWTVTALLQMGDLDAARPHASLLLDLVGRRSMPLQPASNGLIPIIYQSCLEGNWKAGREYSDRGLNLSPVNARILSLRILLEHETGESDQAEMYTKLLLEAMPEFGPDQKRASVSMSMVVLASARITGVPAHLEIAESAAQAILSSPFATPLFTSSAKFSLALMAVRRADIAAATELYSALEAIRINAALRFSWVMATDRLLGLLSITMGNFDQATEHFEDSMALCRKGGYRPELAWTCCDYADTLLRRNSEGDQAKATSLLDDSLAISSELGMRPLMERVLSRQKALET